MSIQDLGSLGEFIASIAVVISLVYLAYQVRQNTQQQRRAEMNAAFEAGTWFRSATLSSDASDLAFKLISDPDSLSKSEKFKVAYFLEQTFWYAFQTWDRERLNVGSYASWTQGAAPMIESFKGNKVALNWWNRNRFQYPPKFAETIDKTLSQ